MVDRPLLLPSPLVSLPPPPSTSVGVMYDAMDCERERIGDAARARELLDRRGELGAGTSGGGTEDNDRVRSDGPLVGVEPSAGELFAAAGDGEPRSKLSAGEAARDASFAGRRSDLER